MILSYIYTKNSIFNITDRIIILFVQSLKKAVDLNRL